MLTTEFLVSYCPNITFVVEGRRKNLTIAASFNSVNRVKALNDTFTPTSVYAWKSKHASETHLRRHRAAGGDEGSFSV